CFGVYGGCLDKIPIAEQGHHIVVPIDVRLQYFTTSGIAHVGAIGIGNGGGQIPYHRIPHIFWRPFWVFLGRWWIFGDDGVLETGRLKGNLPILDALFDERYPFFWGGAIHIIYNGLFGLNELSGLELFNVLVLDLQSPTVQIGNGL